MNEQDYKALIERCKEKISKLGDHEKQAARIAWDLADELAPIEIVNKGQNGKQDADGVTLIQLSEDLGVTRHWISQLRRAAKRFPPSKRVPGIGPAIHLAAQRGGKDPDEAIALMNSLGDKVRMRDFVPEIEDGAALRALRDRESAERIFASMTEADVEMWREVMARPKRKYTRSNTTNGTALATIRRARTMLTTIAQAADTVADDEDFVQEVRAIEEVVKRLVDAVAVRA